MACKYGFYDSEILNLHFIIDRVDARNPFEESGVNKEYAVRPNLMEDIKVTGGIEFLDTPYSMRTPSHSFTPSYTPSYYREPSIRYENIWKKLLTLLGNKIIIKWNWRIFLLMWGDVRE